MSTSAQENSTTTFSKFLTDILELIKDSDNHKALLEIYINTMPDVIMTSIEDIT